MVDRIATAGISILARDAPALRSGQVVELRVVRNLIGRKWLIAIGGRLYPAQTERALKANQRLQALVEGNGQRVVLRVRTAAQISAQLSERVATDRALIQIGIQPDHTTRLLAAALLRSGRTLIPKEIDALRRTLARVHAPNAEAARLLVEGRAKGLTLSPERLQSLMAHSPQSHTTSEEIDANDQSGSGRPTSDRDEQHQQHGQDKQKEPGHRPPHREQRSPDRRSIAATAAAPVKVYSGSNAEANTLQLFNHLRASGEDHWILVPIRTSAAELGGVLRLHFEGDPPRLVHAILDVGNSKGRWCSLLALKNRRVQRVQLAITPTHQLQKANQSIARLRSVLQKIGIETAPSTALSDYFDGFSIVERLPIAVDTEV